MYISRIHIIVMVLVVLPVLSLVVSAQLHLGEVKSKYSNLSLIESLAKFERDILALRDSYQKKAEQIGESKQIKRLLERWDANHDRDEIQASLFSEVAGQIELLKAKKIMIIGSEKEILTDSDNYNHFGELHKDENTERAFKGYNFFILDTVEEGFLFHYEIPVRTQKKIMAVISIDFIEPKESIQSLTHIQVFANESFFLLEPNFPLQDIDFFKPPELSENLKEILKEQKTVSLSDGISYFVRAQKTLIPNQSQFGMLWIAFVEQDKILKPFQMFNLSLLVALLGSLLLAYLAFVFPFKRWLKGFQQIRTTIVEAHTYERKELPNNFKDSILKDMFDLCLILLNPTKKPEPFSLKGVPGKSESKTEPTKTDPKTSAKSETPKAGGEAIKTPESKKAEEPAKTTDSAKAEKVKTEPPKQVEATKEPPKPEETKAEQTTKEAAHDEEKQENENSPEDENSDETEFEEINYEKIYEEFVTKKKELGENSATMNFETFQKQLMKNLEQLKKNHPDKAINFSVIVKDNKVSIQPKLRKL